jgi:hypothetical protein
MDDQVRNTIQRFHDALNCRDLDALGDLITDDCVFEATSPAPDGTRHVGRQGCLRRVRPSSPVPQPRISRWRRCSVRGIGPPCDGSTPGRMATSVALTCSGSEMDGWRRRSRT